MDKFQADYDRYSKFENIVADALNETPNGCNYIQASPDEAFTDYDIHCTNHRFCPTIECKFDIMSRNYRSFLFEVKLIKNSKADEWWFGDGVEAFVFERPMIIPVLRELYRQNRAWIIDVGDGKRTKCVKVMRHTLLPLVEHRRFAFEVAI